MSSPSTKPFKKPSKLPFCVHLYMPKPLYHPTSNKCIIITTNFIEYETTTGIYTYNIETNKSQTVYKYNNTFKPTLHDQFIDPSNNTLIL
eukprot:536151_1